jgi:hypothetical protein
MNLDHQYAFLIVMSTPDARNDAARQRDGRADVSDR